MLNAITMLVILIGFLALTWVIWFVIEFVRYLASGDYEVDQRLHKVTH